MPDDPQNPDSLGDDHTFTGERDVPQEEQRSLGDQATAGDALSSISDLELDGQASDSDLPLIDLTRFEMEGELGKGGMGAVQLATDRQLKRQVAIKRILASSQSALARFVTEAQSIAALNHFNIVQIYEFGRDAEGPLLVMEYVSGGSLLDRLKEGKLEVEDAIGITCQLCDALAVAHEQGIIHRDIKPANILLTTRGEPKLTDFGLARQDNVDHGQTQAGAVLGTIDFMPPEQRRDATSVDARSDLWSLAATAYQMITGSSPKVIRLDQLPANLAPVIGTMLEENPDNRYATAEQFKTELRKGMATAAAPVAVDLAAGVCPACSTPNEASRKFCRGCRASLFEPCLSCESDIPVWEDVCGQCGNSQQEKRNETKSILLTTLEESLSLAREHEYEMALSQLEIVQDGGLAFAEDIYEQADEQIKLIKAERDEQLELRDQLVEMAEFRINNHDYVAAIRGLEKIPDPLRSEAIVSLLTGAENSQAKLSSLLEEIRQAAKAQQLHGLLEKTDRYLQLKPNDEQILSLQKKLQAKAERDRPQIEAIVTQVQAAHDSQQYDAVLTALDNCPKALILPSHVEELRDLATTYLARAQELSEQIAAMPTAVVRLPFLKDFSKLPLLEEYLLLRPGDEQAHDLRRKIRHKKTMLIGGVALATTLLLFVAGLWIHFSYKSRAAIAAKKAAIEKAATDSVITLKGHASYVQSVTFSPDGKWIASGSGDRTVKIWGTETGGVSFTLKGHTDGVFSVAFSPDGKRFVSGSNDKTLKVWDTKTSLELLTLKGHADGVYSVAFSPDGKRIISGSNGKIKVWDTDSGEEVFTFGIHSGPIWGVSCSPDGKRIVSGSTDKTLKVLAAENGREIFTLVGHSGFVSSVSYSPDGTRIVSGSHDKTLKVWDAETGQELLTLEGHTGGVLSVAFSPDGKRFVSGSMDKTLKIWDAETGQELLTLKGHLDSVWDVAFNPDGTRIVSGSLDGTLKLWRVPPLTAGEEN